MSEKYEVVIGLEVHTELSTATKLFCGCPNEFGGEPNTRVCPVCLGLPGALPVINEGAVELALRIGSSLNCDTPEQSIFARKNYFYPDMPKDFQISQYEEPICIDGWLEVGGERVGIERAHMEEDTGKTTHVGGGGRIHDAQYSLVDYNRAGVPLMEIVSRPDIRSAEQARAYVTELRSLLQAIGASDVKMEEGSLRVDANVSLRPAGAAEFGTKVEIKNMNSLRSLGRALEYEIDRQTGFLDRSERIAQETRHWNEDEGKTHSLRSKEEAFDYRYFPEPDLVPLAPDEEFQARARAGIPELPAARRARLVTDWGINEEDARTLVSTPGLADYAEEAAAALKAGMPADVARWCTGGVLAHVHESNLSVEVLPLAPDGLAELVALVADGTLSRKLAQDVLAECLQEPKRPKQVVAERGLEQVSDEGELSALVDQLIADHPTEADNFRTDDPKVRKKMQSFFMGKAMAETKGQANPKILNQLLGERLG